jgi:hypothetical protein
MRWTKKKESLEEVTSMLFTLLFTCLVSGWPEQSIPFNQQCTADAFFSERL